MELGLRNKVIVITSGDGRIGEAIVRVLSAEDAIAEIVGERETDKGNLSRNEPAVYKKAVDAIFQKYGRIDGLVNYAGVNGGLYLDTINNIPFRDSLVHVLGHYYLMTHFALPYLKISQGSIVNVNSKTMDIRQGNRTAFGAADGGLSALTREWAVEMLKYRIRVNAITVSESPGLENTVTTWSSIARTVAFLLSEKSSHTTGQQVYADGACTTVDPAHVNV